jgi:hypothetical protein
MGLQLAEDSRLLAHPSPRMRTTASVVLSYRVERATEERALGDPQRGFGSIGGVGARQGAVKATELKYEEGRPGGFDPAARRPSRGVGADRAPGSRHRG